MISLYLFLGYVIGHGVLKGIGWDVCPTRPLLPHLTHATLLLLTVYLMLTNGIYAVWVEGLISGPSRPDRDGWRGHRQFNTDNINMLHLLPERDFPYSL